MKATSLLKVSVLVGITCSAVMIGSAFVRAEEGGVKTTLENLQAAYNGESNAHARYLAFAQKADEEGYGKVASLFRAAAQAEEIHLNNHAEVIKSLNAPPSADIKEPEVKSTRENLEAALAGENYERIAMYPEFLEQAKKEDNGKAVRTFKWAMEAETKHAEYYQAALNDLENWRDGKMTFLVCTECGYTTDDMSTQKCPVCSYPRNKMDEVE